jgi:hypothetical protein
MWWRHEHGEIRFAAGTREGRRDVGFLSTGRFHAEDEHVLREPAFVASKIGTDPQGETFFPQQGVTAVIGTHRDHGVVVWKMHDETAIWIHIQGAMESPIELIAFTQMLPRDLAHAGHNSHGKHDIDGIGQFDTDFGKG